MKHYEKILEMDQSRSLFFKDSPFNDKGIYKPGLREYPKSNCKEQDNHLSSVLKKLFPNNIFVHNKFIKHGGEYIFDHNGSKIRPDFFCEELKMIIEFDGESWQGGGHFTDPNVAYKDLDHTTILGKLGYTVIRIPFYVQLDKEAIKHYFNIDYTGQLYEMCYDHGFLYPDMKTPAFFCELGLNRFIKDLWELPIDIVHRILMTIDYLYLLNNDNKKPVGDWVGGEYIIPHYLKYEPNIHPYYPFYPTSIIEEIQKIIVERKITDHELDEGNPMDICLLIMDIPTKYRGSVHEIITEDGEKYWEI